MPNYKAQSSDGKTINHYGVKGMRWGVIRSKLQSTHNRFKKNTAYKRLIYDEDLSLFGKKGRANAVNQGKKILNKITGNKAFKSMVFDKDKSLLTSKGKKAFKEGELKDAKSRVDKVTSSKAFKALVFNKDAPSILNSKGKAVVGKVKSGLKKAGDNFNKAQVRDQNKEIKRLKAKGDKKSLKEAKDLQDELNYLFTPEELKKYS